MKIDQGIIDRILEVVEEKNLSRAEFSHELGYESNKISEVINGYTKELSNQFVIILKLRFGINPQWLESGYGEKYIVHSSVTDQKEIHLLKNYRRLVPEYQDKLLQASDTYYLEWGVAAGYLTVAENKPSYGSKKDK